MRSFPTIATICIGFILFSHDSSGSPLKDKGSCLFSAKMESPAFRDGYRKKLAELRNDIPTYITARTYKVETLAEKIKRADYETAGNDDASSLGQNIIKADYETTGNDDVAFMVQRISNADYDYRGIGGLDPFSVICLTCHDGSIASGIENGVQGGLDNNGHIGNGNHPIGMSYAGYTRRNFYIPLGALNNDIVMVGGKMGCLSCHNPQNPEKFHLARSNGRSRLCLSCHIK